MTLSNAWEHRILLYKNIPKTEPYLVDLISRAVTWRSMDRKDWKLTNWMVARRELFTLLKEREELSNSKELPATLVRDWATTTMNVKASFFQTFFQKWAYFPGVEFTIVQYHKWSTTTNDLQNGPEWSSTVNDPRCRPQMIQKGKSECLACT